MKIHAAPKSPALSMLLLAVLTLSGCIATGTLSDGRRTLMGDAGMSTREALVGSEEPFRGLLNYKPVTLCEYSLTETQRPPLRSYAADLTVNIRPVGNQLFIKTTTKEGASIEDSTAVIGLDGQLFRFNMMNIAIGRRVTSENFAEVAEAKLNQLGLSDSSDSNFLNVFSLFTPHYRDHPLRVGRRIAQVFDETGAVWGHYVYAGLSEFAGRKVLILDLVRTFNAVSDLGELVIGFSLVDPENMLPVYSTVDFGANGGLMRLQRVRCDG